MYILKGNTSIYHPILRQMEDEYLTPCGLTVSLDAVFEEHPRWPPFLHVVEKLPKRHRLCQRCDKILASKT
jgi:hypothetical protein